MLFLNENVEGKKNQQQKTKAKKYYQYLKVEG